jgi:hypothetical protein
MRQTNIIWAGRLYHSIENCLMTSTSEGNEITSTIIGNHGSDIYKVDYHIKTNKHWETIFLTLQTRFNNSSELTTLEKKEENWLLNGIPKDELRNIFDIDISLTPFTNTLPINRLNFITNEPIIIDVLYFDILNRNIIPVKQSYTKLTTNLYAYERMDTNFKATIKVDEQGLVSDYPDLFELTVKNETIF